MRGQRRTGAGETGIVVELSATEDEWSMAGQALYDMYYRSTYLVRETPEATVRQRQLVGLRIRIIDELGSEFSSSPLPKGILVSRVETGILMEALTGFCLDASQKEYIQSMQERIEGIELMMVIAEAGILVG